MSLRKVYTIEDQNWLAPKSALTEQEAYEALLDLYQTGMTDAQWALACADLRNAGLPAEERHGRYLVLVAAREQLEVAQ